MKLYEYDTQVDYDSLNWKTDEMIWSKFIQVKQNHVRAARGIIVGNDVWVDHYAVLGSMNYLEEFLRDKYGSEYDTKKENGEVIFWKITGNPAFQVDYPEIDSLTGHHVGMVKMLAEEMKIPPSAALTWKGNEELEWKDINELLYA